MRQVGALLAALALCAMATACDSSAADPDAGHDAGGASGDAGRDSGTPGEDSGTPGEDSGTPGEDSGTPEEDSGTPPTDAGSTAAPVITRIEWEAGTGCSSGVTSPFTIRVMVTDADTAAGSLTFSGNVTSCTGTINMATSVITCPNFSTYAGNVTVMDPEGNSDSATFAFGPCDTGGVDL